MKQLLLSSALCLMALPALAENHALLIGANTYPNLKEDFWLKGPANDVKLVQTYLTTAAPVPFAPQNVVVLADGVEGAPAPTLAAIRAAFADLAAKAQDGDFVYLHFSGHGSQAPARDPESELDGLDELFLPVDIGPWNDQVGEVENALVDDEIGQLIDAIRAKGAHVWAVFDSCHSGTVTRAAPFGDEEVRVRQLPPDALGLPPDALEGQSRSLAQPDARAKPEAPVDIGTGTGSFTAFFAAQTNEVTPEKNLPKGKPGRVPQGVFTYTLFETLAEYPGATYGQIGQEVLRKYAVKNLARSTPLFEGDLGAIPFLGTPGPRVEQWPTTAEGGEFTLPAGSLHGLAPGAVLALMPNAAAATEEAIGKVLLTSVDTFTAVGTAEGDALPDPLPRGLYLRKTESAVDFTLTVALPEGDSAPAQALAAAMDALTEAAGPRITLVPAGADADLRLAVIPDSPRPDAIWVLPGTGLAEDLSQTPSVSTADKDAASLGATLGDTLTTMSKALNLLRLGAAVGPGTLDVEVELQTRQGKGQPLVPLARDAVPRLVPMDEVHVLARNHMDQPVDVNVLYVAANYEISHWFSGRLQPGDTLKQGLFRISDDVLGAERMVVVMTPASPQSAVEDLSFLAQDALELTRGVEDGLAASLRDAGFGETTRGAIALDAEEDEGPAPGILQIELRTVPAG
ncbi:MAG: caspase family protein [Cypionkella sp.]|nr:caspase family protein [Cypionkella sp.]